MRLYKYLSKPRTILNDGYIRATQLSCLNDPFEAKYCKTGLEKLCLAHNIDYKDSLAHITNEINKVGVISLTEAKDNLLMWAHYADEHRGVAIGLDVYEDPYVRGQICIFENLIDRPNPYACFDGFDVFSSGRVKPVRYRKQPKFRVDAFDLDFEHLDMTQGEALLYEVFFNKSDEWSYEKEHRAVLHLSQADKVLVPNNIQLRSTLKKQFESLSALDLGDDFIELHLEKIDDASMRIALGNNVATLALYPSVIFLFKLKEGVITNMVFGFRSHSKRFEPQPHYVQRAHCFEYEKASIDDSYVLNFDSF